MTSAHRLLVALVATTSLALAAPAARAQATFNTGAGLFSAKVVSLRDAPFRTVVRQQFDYSCGSAALATLLHYHYGYAVDEAQVFEAMFRVGDQPAIRRVGFSLLDMKRYLAANGLAADGYRETLSDLVATRSPAIAVVQVGAYRHFVVVKGVRDGVVLVGDPALGVKRYSAQAFAQMWDGVLFLIHDDRARGAFNRREDWESLPRASTAPLSERSLAQLTRGLPPLYQISTLGLRP